MYDLNSSPTQKGLLGEKIFVNLAQSRDWHVENMREQYGVYNVDFMCSDKNGEVFPVEVKTCDSKIDYSGRYFLLADQCFDKARNCAPTMKHPLAWCFIDSVTGAAYFADTNDLLKPHTVNGKTYPDRINFDTEGGTQPARAFNFEQFDILGNIDKTDRQQLRAFNINPSESASAEPDKSDAAETSTDSAQGETPTATLTQTLQGSDERSIELYLADGDYYVIAGHLRRTIGFNVINVIKDFKTYRFRPGNKSIPPCFIHLRDVSAFCRQIYDEYKKFRDGTFRKNCAQNALEPARRFEAFIPAFYGEEPAQSSELPAADISRDFADIKSLLDELTKKFFKMFTRRIIVERCRYLQSYLGGH